jgi:hypothetical protein
MYRSIPATLTTLLVALATAGPAPAASSTGTVSIGSCTVKMSRNAGGFAWAFCPVTSKPTNDVAITVHYRVNLKTYVPVQGVSYSAQSGKLGFPGNGPALLNIKFAFKGLTAKQVKRRLRVTLSNPTGAVISTPTATAR